jgi:polyisoprenoid-binding protein YceI
MKQWLGSLLIAGAVGSGGAGASSAAVFTIQSKSEGTRVVFTSKAPMESFEGSTGAVSGRVDLDHLQLADSIGVEVLVDVETLDTGINLRNQHMRKNHLHTDRFPRAVFRGATLVGGHPARLEPGRPETIQVAGEFELHGVKKRLSVPVEVLLTAEKRLQITTTFEVWLVEYGIPRPKMLFMKLDEKQTVTFRAVAVAE